MKDLFIPYELALIAKEKGFNEECIAAYMPTHKHLIKEQGIFNLRTHGNPFGDDIGRVYNNKLKTGVAAPLYQQIVDWLREKHKILILSSQNFLDRNNIKYSYFLTDVKNSTDYSKNKIFNTYYEALNKAIEHAFKLI